MRVVKMVFSPTGGTKNVLDYVASALSKHDVTIDLCDHKIQDVKIQEEDICLIAVPSYGGRVPPVACQRLRQYTGNHAKAVLIVVYGNRHYEDTLIELKHEAEALDFRCMAGLCAVAEHSILRQFAHGRPDAEDKKALSVFVEELKEILRKEENRWQAPGQMPYKKFGVIPLLPKASENCVRCGICATKCPAQAIPLCDPMDLDCSKCIGCMRCVALCPHGVRKVGESSLSAVREKLEKVCAERKENEWFL